MTPATSTQPAEIAFLRDLRQDRTFTTEPVADETLNSILEVARWSGSAKNSQPWEFLVVHDSETLTAISEMGEYAGFLAGAPVAVVLVFDGKGSRSESYDEGRVSERIMLAARAWGLGSGTGWWGTPEGQARVKEYLGIPAHKSVISAVAIGHVAGTSRVTGVQTGRKPLATLVHNERYGSNAT